MKNMLKLCGECRSILDVYECETGVFVMVDVNTGITYLKGVEDICPVCETEHNASPMKELLKPFEAV